MVVVDDLVALVIIATVYTNHLAMRAFAVAVAVFVAVLVVRAAHVRRGLVYAALGAAMWVAFLKSGIDPVVTGLVMGLLAYAYPAGREELERASSLFRLFREQPTAELARSARAGVESAVSVNERLQQIYHPWTSYAFVPLFALANVGIAISGGFLSRAFTSPITLGILVAYVARQAGRHHRHRLARDAAQRAASSGRRSAGPPSRAAARSRASASPSRS